MIFSCSILFLCYSFSVSINIKFQWSQFLTYRYYFESKTFASQLKGNGEKEIHRQSHKVIPPSVEGKHIYISKLASIVGGLLLQNITKRDSFSWVCVHNIQMDICFFLEKEREIKSKLASKQHQNSSFLLGTETCFCKYRLNKFLHALITGPVGLLIRQLPHNWKALLL